MINTAPIVWSIAGFDPSGSAGITLDLKTFADFAIESGSVITAITAQNNAGVKAIHAVPAAHLRAQLEVLYAEKPPQAIKIGMLYNADNIKVLITFLSGLAKEKIAIVLDPLIFSSSGHALFAAEHLADYLDELKKLFTFVSVLTPNVPEAEALLGQKISNSFDMEQAAQKILSLGPASVLIKGGHTQHELAYSQDYWTNGLQAFWMASKRYAGNYRGTGCRLSSGLAAALASGEPMEEALVKAKSYLNTQLSHLHINVRQKQSAIPYLACNFIQHTEGGFPDCGTEPLGLYPVIDSLEWMNTLLALGIKTIQLRIKNKQGEELEQVIQQAIQLANHYGARLFINDYWQAAIKYGAYGVHLGQEDMLNANIQKIYQAGLRLGLSTHRDGEIARALFYQPSYLAFGAIFATTTKAMPSKPQGLVKLKRVRELLHCPLVAIGGINNENCAAVLATGVDGVAVISAITQAADPLRAAQQLMKMVNHHDTLSSGI